MIDEKFDWTILDRFCAGDISTTDRVRLDAWLAADSTRTAVVDALRGEVDRHIALAPEWDVECTWRGILEQMSEDSPGETAPRGGPYVSRPKWFGRPGERGVRRQLPWQLSRWYPLVGVVVAGAVLIIAGLRAFSTHLTMFSARSVSTYTTGNGQRANITLSDGSTVALNVASQLDVPTDYTRGNHTLRLRGEALFTVPHHGSTPFVVVAGPLTARVLGTSFAVRNYATDSVAVVAVREGKVAARSTVVAAMEALKVNRAGVAQMGRSDPTQFSFAAGVLSLDKVPFSEAIADLNRWYDADIRLGDPELATRRVTIECATESLSDLVKILEWTFKLRIVRNGHVLTLFPR